MISLITRYVSLRAIRATVEARALTVSIRRAELASLLDKTMLWLARSDLSILSISESFQSEMSVSETLKLGFGTLE